MAFNLFFECKHGSAIFTQITGNYFAQITYLSFERLNSGALKLLFVLCVVLCI